MPEYAAPADAWRMTKLTSFILRHKALVALAWLLIVTAGVMTVSGTTHRMTNTFSMPGQAFRVNSQIAAQYGTGGAQPPYVAVLTVAPGQKVTDPPVAATTGRVFSAVSQGAAGHPVRIADYASTGNRAFVTNDGRSTFALVYTPATAQGFGAPDPSPAITRALDAALPAGWHAGLTGSSLLQAGTSQSKGTGIMAEAMIGAIGSLVILALVLAASWPSCR
jgi:RND superfamily putative drug exporter